MYSVDIKELAWPTTKTTTANTRHDAQNCKAKEDTKPSTAELHHETHQGIDSARLEHEDKRERRRSSEHIGQLSSRAYYKGGRGHSYGGCEIKDDRFKTHQSLHPLGGLHGSSHGGIERGGTSDRTNDDVKFLQTSLFGEVVPDPVHTECEGAVDWPGPPTKKLRQTVLVCHQ